MCTSLPKKTIDRPRERQSPYWRVASGHAVAVFSRVDSYLLGYLCMNKRTVTLWRYAKSLASFRRTYQPPNHRPNTPNGSAYSTQSSKMQAEGPSGSKICVCFQYANGPETWTSEK